jgi:phosphate acyltransferase
LGGNGPARVAVDAMGGDHAPAAVVAGALRAHRAGAARVVLVGDAERIADALGEAEDAPEIVHAPEVVDMHDEPALALRRKRDSSIRVAAQLVADGKADALVSAGSTGATVAAAMLIVGRRGVRRPAVAARIPLGGRGGREAFVLVDAGANIDVQPDALASYARMGRAYARAQGVAEPAVALLNVGEEPGKGNELARAAFELLGDVEGFIGNLEPPGVLAGAADVVVTDGFTGNVFLKTLEATGLASEGSPGAAVVLGVAGEVLVAHGAAGADEIEAAVRTAADVARAGLADRVGRALQEAPTT